VPPFVWVDLEAFLFESLAQKCARAPLFGCAALVVGRGPVGHFIKGSGHGDLFAAAKLVQAHIDRAAAVVA